MAELAYVNGVFSRIEDAKVSIEDRGFQFGDGVYEVIAAYNGRLFLLDEHMKRLRDSTAAIHLDYDFERNPIEPIVHEALRRSDIRDAAVYVQITRGAAPRSHVIPKVIEPTLVLTVRPLAKVPQELRDRGAKVLSVPDYRWSHCHIKAITLLANVLAKREAMTRGFDEAVFVARDGLVMECTASNIFMARRGALTFPPRTESVLHGITQAFLLDCARSLGQRVEERSFTLDDLYAADEAFMSSTSIEVVGITSVDGKRIGDGKVGPITRRMHEEFARRARGGCTAACSAA